MGSSREWRRPPHGPSNTAWRRWRQWVQRSTTSSLRSPRLSKAGALFGAGTLVKELAQDHLSFDNDGFCALVKHGSLPELVAAVGGVKHSISPVAAHHAENRKLYSPQTFAMVGLGWPDRRQGVGLCVQRNSRGLSRNDIGRPWAGGLQPADLRAAPRRHASPQHFVEQDGCCAAGQEHPGLSRM